MPIYTIFTGSVGDFLWEAHKKRTIDYACISEPIAELIGEIGAELMREGEDKEGFFAFYKHVGGVVYIQNDRETTIEVVASNGDFGRELGLTILKRFKNPGRETSKLLKILSVPDE